MKLPFLNKNINSSSSSSSWPWPSCHQNPKTLSFRNTTKNTTFFDSNEFSFPNSTESAPATFLFSSTAISNDTAGPPEPESIENVIERLRSSERLIFEKKGESNSILEEANKAKPPKENGFALLSLESNDPYSDFKRSMEEMVEAHALSDWGSLEKLLYWFLKVNVKTSHGFIFAAFVDLLVSIALAEAGKNDGVSGSSAAVVTVSDSGALRSCSNDRNVVHGQSPASPLSFYTSCSSSYSSSDECSSSVRCVSSSLESPEVEKGAVDDYDRTCCLSSLLEMDEKIKDIDGYFSC